MNFTVANHNNAKNSKGFIHYDDVKFKDIPKMVMSGYAYAAGKFKDNHRLNDNWLGFEDVLILDIDEICTIDQAMVIFSRYEYYIITSRSHQKEKNGIICDRFRVFLHLSETINDMDDRDNFMQQVMCIYSFVDQSTKDRARFFYASPIDSKIYYNEGKRMPVTIICASSTPPPKKANDSIIPTDDIYRLCELSCQWIDKNGNTLDTGYNEHELNVEAKFKGARIVLDNEFYSGNRANAIFKIACMLKNDGLDEDTICDFLIRENDSRDGLRLNELMQNIKGSFRASR